MFQVVWTYDGCVDNTAAEPMTTMDECKEWIRLYMAKDNNERRFKLCPKLGLDICDLESGRLVSYVL
jgi:hypothetical protein